MTEKVKDGSTNPVALERATWREAIMGDIVVPLSERVLEGFLWAISPAYEAGMKLRPLGERLRRRFYN